MTAVIPEGKRTAKIPAGAADCHIHIYGSPSEYPLALTAPYPPPLATVRDYREVMAHLGLSRAVVVQPAAYGIDNRCTLDAVAEFGQAARAVVVITPDTPRSEIRQFHVAGARGARFFLMRGAVVTWSMLRPVAKMIADWGWHIQLQFNGRELPEHETEIRALPCTVVIDHLGKFIDPVLPDHSAAQTLLRLLETGRVWVKASSPYETSHSGPPDYEDVIPIAEKLIQAVPDRVVWASNWPHGGQKTKPDDLNLLGLLDRWSPNLATRNNILVTNAERLYGFS